MFAYFRYDVKAYKMQQYTIFHNVIVFKNTRKQMGHFINKRAAGSWFDNRFRKIS